MAQCSSYILTVRHNIFLAAWFGTGFQLTKLSNGRWQICKNPQTLSPVLQQYKDVHESFLLKCSLSSFKSQSRDQIPSLFLWPTCPTKSHRRLVLAHSSPQPLNLMMNLTQSFTHATYSPLRNLLNPADTSSWFSLRSPTLLHLSSPASPKIATVFQLPLA